VIVHRSKGPLWRTVLEIAGVFLIYMPLFGLWWVALGYWQERARVRERCILDLLSEGPMYGLDLVKKSNGLLKRGTVYVLLGRMHDRGLVEAELDSGSRRRYRLARIDSTTTRKA
jgi:hypothetical protein